MSSEKYCGSKFLGFYNESDDKKELQGSKLFKQVKVSEFRLRMSLIFSKCQVVTFCFVMSDSFSAISLNNFLSVWLIDCLSLLNMCICFEKTQC